MNSKQDIKQVLTRQLELLKENLKLRNELEFRDYRIQKLEKDLQDIKKLVSKSCYKEQESIHKIVNIYI